MKCIKCLRLQTFKAIQTEIVIFTVTVSCMKEGNVFSRVRDSIHGAIKSLSHNALGCTVQDPSPQKD